MIGFNDIVIHKPTKLYYIICGGRSSDGEKYWYNVVQLTVQVTCMEDTLSAKHIYYTTLVEGEIRMYKRHPLNLKAERGL